MEDKEVHLFKVCNDNKDLNVQQCCQTSDPHVVNKKWSADNMATGFEPSVFEFLATHAALTLLEFLGVGLRFITKLPWPEKPRCEKGWMALLYREGLLQ